jgi:hypothetical protein
MKQMNVAIVCWLQPRSSHYASQQQHYKHKHARIAPRITLCLETLMQRVGDNCRDRTRGNETVLHVAKIAVWQCA